MRKTNLFLAVIIASLASMTVLIVAGMYVFTAAQQSPYSWMSGMGGMMGGTGQTSTQNPALPIFGATFVILLAIILVGVVGLAYYVALPEIKSGASPKECEPVQQNNPGIERKRNGCTPLESILKTLSVEERKVIEVLIAHDGKYLQKYIRNETDLSRLKTHRVLARLASRGIVTLEKTGNTNQVLLAEWLEK